MIYCRERERAKLLIKRLFRRSSHDLGETASGLAICGLTAETIHQAALFLILKKWDLNLVTELDTYGSFVLYVYNKAVACRLKGFMSNSPHPPRSRRKWQGPLGHFYTVPITRSWMRGRRWIEGYHGPSSLSPIYVLKFEMKKFDEVDPNYFYLYGSFWFIKIIHFLGETVLSRYLMHVKGGWWS